MTNKDAETSSTSTTHTIYSVSQISAFIYHHRLEDRSHYLEHDESAIQQVLLAGSMKNQKEHTLGSATIDTLEAHNLRCV